MRPLILPRCQQPTNIIPPHFANAANAGILFGGIAVRAVCNYIIYVLRPIPTAYFAKMTGVGNDIEGLT
ncbi:hypothetical protein CDL62_17075 [Alkalitalea saponilacus]|nr:hypothetical protein CDL62_17075 [Alkalitalea saponilacus]